MNLNYINLPMDNCVNVADQIGSAYSTITTTTSTTTTCELNLKQMKNNNKNNYEKLIEEVDSDDPNNNTIDDDQINRTLNEIKLSQHQTLLNNANCSHCHDLSMDNIRQEQSKNAINKLTIGLIICTLFMFVELIGGYLSDSLAIFTDAAHLLSDIVSFIIGLTAIYFSQKEATKKKSFGYFRFELIGVLFSVLIIWFLASILVYMAIKRIIQQEFELNSGSMLAVSIIGLIMNAIMWLILSDKFCHNHAHATDTSEPPHQHSHGNGAHGHSHMNMNVRAAILHIVGDIIQSIGVLVAALIVHFWPHLKLADPICTILFAILVFMTTYSIMKDTIHILMEGFPPDISYEIVRTMLCDNIPDIRSVHSLHVWSLTHGRNVLSVHLTVDFNTINNMKKIEKIRNQAEMLIRTQLNINNTTIQIEQHHEQLIQSCHQCSIPR